jgi:hypothetical protein
MSTISDMHIEKFTTESEKRYEERKIFIEKCNQKYPNKEKEIIRLSKIWYNIKYNKAKYDKDIYETIKKIDGRI